jgi:WD40 repeat protein
MVAKFEAELNAEKAELNYQFANKLYMLTKAQELASKAAVQDDDDQVAGLQAMQAYKFHTKYEGRKYDRYIYEGLYNAQTKLSGTSYNAMKVEGPPRVHMRSLALSSGNTFYVSGADGRIYHANTDKLTNRRTGYETAYPSKVIALSKDENYLVNGNDSTVIHIYDLNKKASPRIISGLGGATNDIEFLPDNSAFIIASQDKSLRKIDMKSWNVTTLLTLPTEVKAISIRNDGAVLAAATWTGQVLIIDLASKQITELVNEPNSRILSVEFSASGKMLAYGMEEGSRRGLVRLYSFESKTNRQFSGHRAGVYDVEFSPDEKLLASAGSDKRLQLYVLESPEDLPVVMENNNGFIWDIEFTNGSDFLIAACSESEIRVWPTDPALLAKEICPKRYPI